MGYSYYYYWVREMSLTLDCSIEISRDIYIYICRYICRYVGLSTKNSQNAWEELPGPNMRMLKVSLGRLKQTCDTRSIHLDYTYSSFRMDEKEAEKNVHLEMRT